MNAKAKGSKRELKSQRLLEVPPLKKAKPMIKTIQRGVAKGDGFVDNDQRRAQAFNRFRIYNQLYLKHQLQVIELCIKRAEFNNNLTGKKDVP